MTQQDEQNRATWNGRQWKTPAMQQSLAMQQAMARVRELTELDVKGKEDGKS